MEKQYRCMITGQEHWSNCAYPAKLFKTNAIVSVPFLGLLLFPSWKMLYLAVGTIAFFIYVETVKKTRAISVWRSLNIIFTGRIKTTRNVFKEFLNW